MNKSLGMSNFILLMRRSASRTIWQLSWHLISLCWMNLRHHYCEPCGDGFDTTQPRHEAQIQTTAFCQQSQRKLYRFPIDACSFMRTPGHRNIAHKEEADHWSSQEDSSDKEEKGRGQMIMYKSESTAQINSVPTFKWTCSASNLSLLQTSNTL